MPVLCSVSVQCLQDEEEPSDANYSPDGGYIPRILFVGKKIDV